MRQHEGRLTGADRRFEEQAHRYATGEPQVAHLFPPPAGHPLTPAEIIDRPCRKEERHMLLPDERAALVTYCLKMQADDLTVGTSGNLSVRSGDLVAITPSGWPTTTSRRRRSA
jgi:hypothetical protein